MHCLISSWWYPLVSAYTYSYSILGGTLVQIQTCNPCQTKCYYIIVIIVIIYKTCIVCLDRSAHKSFALSSRRILNLAVVIVLIAWEWCFVMSVISSYFPLCQRHFTSKQIAMAKYFSLIYRKTFKFCIGFIWLYFLYEFCFSISLRWPFLSTMLWTMMFPLYMYPLDRQCSFKGGVTIHF